MAEQRPSVVRLEQAADVELGDAAGGNIYHYGDLPAGLRMFLGQEAEFRRLLLAALERQADEFRDEVEELRKENAIWRATDDSQRRARQQAEDRYKSRIVIALVVLALVVGVAVLVLAALVYDRLALVAGLALISLYAARRGLPPLGR